MIRIGHSASAATRGRDGAKHRALEVREAVRPHHHEVKLFLIRVTRDRVTRIPNEPHGAGLDPDILQRGNRAGRGVFKLLLLVLLRVFHRDRRRVTVVRRGHQIRVEVFHRAQHFKIRLVAEKLTVLADPFNGLQAVFGTIDRDADAKRVLGGSRVSHGPAAPGYRSPRAQRS